MTFGLRRELIGEDRRSKGRLEKGESKSLQTDRVRLALGSEQETDIVKWIFHQFVVEQENDAEIARQLNRANVANQHGRNWTEGMIHNILRNENYIGHIVYNRTSRRLGQKLVNNPTDRWVRSDLAVDPIVDRDLFARAREIMDNRYVSITEDEMLQRLRELLKRKGRLTLTLVNSTPGLPSASSYMKHFGSIRKAFALIGYQCRRDCDWIDSRQDWAAVLASHATRIVAALNRLKHVSAEVGERSSITVNGKTLICLIIARQTKRGPNHAASWRVYRRKRLTGLLVVLRLDAANRSIGDYLVMPASSLAGNYLHFSAHGDNHGAIRVDVPDDLIPVIKDQLTKIRRRSKQSRRH